MDCKQKNNCSCFLAGVLLMACSIGIYQAFIPVMMSLALLCFIQKIIVETSDNLKKLILSGLYLAGAVISSILLYFLINKCILAYKGLSLIDYKNLSTMGKESISVYLARTVRAVRYFFVPENIGNFTSMFPFQVKNFYIIILLSVSMLSLYVIIKIFRKNIFRGSLLIMSVLLFPITCNFIFVMCEFEHVSTTMLYGQSMLFVYLMFFINISDFSKLNIMKAVYGFGIALALLISFSYCRYANICYLEVEYQQQRMISYFNVLIAQIKSTEGYQDEMPICYVNERNKQDLTLQELNGFNSFYIAPNYSMKNDGINDYAWIEFMNNWCAFSPETVDEEDFVDLPEVIDMPYYPDDGSIKIINDTVVVKFGPVEEE